MKKLTNLILLCLLFISSYAQKDEQRFYYNFRTKTLFYDQGQSKQAFAPLRYKAGRDINIEISHYNPLQYEISTEETSTNFFLSDTAKLSSRIILPSIPNAPSAASLPNATAGQQNVQGDLNNLFDDPANGRVPVQVTGISSCNFVKAAQSKLNDEKALLQQKIREYKDLVSTIEAINNSYDNLKALPELNSVAVILELQNNFLAALNGYLTSNSSTTLGSNPLAVSAASLDLRDQEFFQRIVDEFDEIQDIKTALDKIPNNPACSGYDQLYKEFRDNYDLIQKAYSDFTTLRTAHLSIFKTTTALYDKLKALAVADPLMVTSATTIEKDLHTITLKTKMGTAAVVNYDYIHIEPVKGFKLDVAPGFFFSTLSDRSFSKHSMDSIHQKKYVQNGIVRDTIVQESYVTLFEKENTHVSFGGMIFLQAHSQYPGSWNFGGYLGFGALFNDQARWCGSVGGSVLIGKKQHFNINIGYIVSQVDRLSPPYGSGMAYRETIDNIPTYRAWKGGGMVGFSWNL